MRQQTMPSLVQIMAYRLFGVSEPMLGKLYEDPGESISVNMMTSSNGNIFRVTGHLCGEFTGHQAGDLRRYRDHHDVTVMKF